MRRAEAEIGILKQENNLLRWHMRNARHIFDVHKSILNGATADPYASLFEFLHETFAIQHVYVLIEEGDHLHCVAAENSALLGSKWARDPFMERVLNGVGATTISCMGAPAPVETVSGDTPELGPCLFLPTKMFEQRGVLVLERGSTLSPFDRLDVSLGKKCAIVASQAMIALNGKRSATENDRLLTLSRELERRAYRDELTGLANRALLREHTDIALLWRQPEESFALAFIDLDRFKQVNDYYGHVAGDQLLVTAARRIQRFLEGEDLLGRLSGDQFLLLLNPIESPAALQAKLERISAALNEPYIIHDHEIHCYASIGISLCPDHGEDYETLRRNADNAMLRAKSSQKHHIVSFDDAMGQAERARLDLEARLRVAIEQKQFFSVFQPQISTRTGSIAGFEALVRWRDETGAIRAPGDFLEVAAELGELDQITEIVCDGVLEAFDQLGDEFGDDFSMSLNVSGAQATDHEFMARFVAKIMASGFSKRMMMEITEESMVATGQFRATIHPLLVAAGIGASIDDFGTGFSSLSTLASLKNIDELKIDRAFVAGVDSNRANQRILQTIVSLAASMDMKTVAEGVETQEELDYILNQTSVDLIQGYLIARPLTLRQLQQDATALKARASHARRIATPATFHRRRTD